MRHLAFLACFCFVACEFCVAISLGGPVKIQGRVIFEPTKRPLKDVVVKLQRPDRSPATLLKTAGQGGVPQVLAVTKTDSSGNFSFVTSRPGPYDIICFRPGRHSGDGALDIDPTKFVVINYKPDPAPFSLRPGEEPPKP
jgi:hypothetical protein